MFSHGDLSAATRKYATFYALRFQLMFVVSLPGGAKGRHVKTRQNHQLAGFRVATFRIFTPVCRIFALRGERSPRENPPKSQIGGFSLGADNTTWHKSATIVQGFWLPLVLRNVHQTCSIQCCEILFHYTVINV